jgi:DNA-directed RNA polymerase subunit omega
VDIIRLPIDIEDENVDSRFRLVAIAAQRAKELAYGAKPKIDSKYTKISSISIQEAATGVLEFITGDEAKIANEEARKFDYKRFFEEKKKDSIPEDLSELEKDLKVYLNEREEFNKQVLEDLFTSKDDDKKDKSAK